MILGTVVRRVEIKWSKYNNVSDGVRVSWGSIAGRGEQNLNIKHPFPRLVNEEKKVQKLVRRRRRRRKSYE